MKSIDELHEFRKLVSQKLKEVDEKINIIYKQSEDNRIAINEINKSQCKHDGEREILINDSSINIHYIDKIITHRISCSAYKGESAYAFIICKNCGKILRLFKKKEDYLKEIIYIKSKEIKNLKIEIEKESLF